MPSASVSRHQPEPLGPLGPLESPDPPAATDLSRVSEVSGLIVRARRRGDLSQRDLATAVGVSQSTIAALETGDREPALALFLRILAAGGLRLAVVDSSGKEVRPVASDTVRDNAGRRLPAHLDADPPDRKPWYRAVNPERGRKPVKAWYRLRVERDRVRAGEAQHPHLLPDHPTHAELEARRRQQLYGARPPAPGSDRDAGYLECECETECWLGTACSPQCLCQCETTPRLDPCQGRIRVSHDSDAIGGSPTSAIDCELRTPGSREPQ